MVHATPSNGTIVGDLSVFDTATSELIATHDENVGEEAEYDRITRRLYVTPQRTFYLVESFYAFDGRPATSTKPLSFQQARAWCVACGLHEHTIDRYATQAPNGRHAPPAATLLNQHWGLCATVDTSAA